MFSGLLDVWVLPCPILQPLPAEAKTSRHTAPLPDGPHQAVAKGGENFSSFDVQTDFYTVP